MRRLFITILLLLGGFGAYWTYNYWRQHRFDAEIAAAATRYHIAPALVKAVIWRESRFNPGVRGAAGEMGLMQVRGIAAAEWASAEHIFPFEEESCMDPGTNILAGTWYLKRVAQRYGQTDSPWIYALADYNAGRGNVLKWQTGQAATNGVAFLGQIAFPGTRSYVRSILNRYQYYR